ncbi:Wzz/FepE/Etk N-terminal domain-containing protein [Emcibacteraceae bacterium]|nr:Wzz/FepE/Etk N-terminal domain-containing protein [Emcibacteraceae bacterium]
MNNNNVLDDEIDLKVLFSTLWSGKKVILLSMFIFMAFGSIYLNITEREYSVTMVLQPVSGEGSEVAMKGLGGLASLAGVSLPSGTSSDFALFEVLLTSEEIANRLLLNEEIIQGIFFKEWDGDKNIFQRPERGVIGKSISILKLILTGEGSKDYKSPDANRIADHISLMLNVSKNRETGFLDMSIQHDNPAFIASFMQVLVLETDLYLKEKYQKSGREALEFYLDKNDEVLSSVHRNALVELIVKEEQKLMLASREGYFVADPVIGPNISLNPIFPKKYLILVVLIFLGLIAGVGFVLIRNNAEAARKSIIKNE